MDMFLEFLKNNSALLTAIATVVGIVIHIRGDKKTKIERKQKMDEFRNITFDFLVHSFSAICIGEGVEQLIGEYKQKFAKHEPFMTSFEKIKYRNYISMAHNYNQHCLALKSANKSDKDVGFVLDDQQEFIKHISWLGKKTGREQEAQKLKKDYE